MRWLVVAGVLVLAGCARCSGGSRATPDAAARVRRDTDLRTVVMTMMPEYRGVAFTPMRVALTRTVAGDGDWPAVLSRICEQNKFELTGDGKSCTQSPYHLELVGEGERTADFRIDLTVEPGRIEKLYVVPAPLGSINLAAQLPKGPGLSTVRELFTVNVGYRAVNERWAALVSRQLVDLNEGNRQWFDHGTPEGWGPPQPDGGLGGVPDAFTVVLENRNDGATLAIHREGAEVALEYTLVTERE